MPWATPALKEVRSIVRDSIRGQLPGADANVPNSVLRVMSDAQGALCHLTLQYIDWLSLQLLPDTAQHEWLDRHGDIWLTNSDGTTGRKMATLAAGTVTFAGNDQTVVPMATILSWGAINYETTAQIVIQGGVETPAPVRALDPGAQGNVDPGVSLGVVTPVAGVSTVTVVEITGGVDEENDDDLRYRVLLRIRQPPMGGAAHDYEIWALAVPGCTRAWCGPLEMGMGTITVRPMFDELRANSNPMLDGFPLAQDIQAVADYLDTVRPVAIKDIFVEAPIPEPINFSVANLTPNTTEMQAALEESVAAMLKEKAKTGHSLDGILQPATEIWAAWVAEAGMQAPGIESFTLIMDDHPMPDNGHLAVMGTVTYV